MPASRFTWDTLTLRYRDAATGRFIPQQTVFRELERVIHVSERRMLAIAARYQQGSVSLVEFKLLMRAEVKSLHIATGIVANGGLSQMDSRAWGEVGARLRSEYGYLNGFGRDIAQGRLAPQTTRLKWRARSYASGARIEFWRVTNDRLSRTGQVVMAQRVLGPVISEHCPDCNALKNKWYLLSELPAIGGDRCRWFCRCYIIYKIVRNPLNV